MKRKALLVGAIGLFAAAGFVTGCKNPVRALERKTILKRIWSLTSLMGVYSETGIAAQPQRTENYWRAEPAAVLARVVSPGPAKGSVLHYDGAISRCTFQRQHLVFATDMCPKSPLSIRCAGSKHVW